MKNLTFDLTERVKQIIEYYGLNPYSMSVKISVSEGTIRKFLAGQIGMKVETLTKILTIFDEISSDWLILGKGNMLREKDNTLPSPYPPLNNTLNTVSLEVYEKKVEECALLKAELKALKEQAAHYAADRGAYSTTTIPEEV